MPVASPARFPPWTWEDPGRHPLRPSGAGVPRGLAGIFPTPLWGQVCPVPCPAAGTARLHTASPPCPHRLLLFLLGAVGLHRCLRAPLPGWPPPSLRHLPGWRSRSLDLPCSPSCPTCCPGQAVLCPLPTLRKELINSFTLRRKRRPCRTWKRPWRSMSESWGAGQGLCPSGAWGELHPCFQPVASGCPRQGAGHEDPGLRDGLG